MPCKLTTVANENIRVQYVAKLTLIFLDSSRDKEQDGTHVFYPGVTTAEIALYIKY